MISAVVALMTSPAQTAEDAVCKSYASLLIEHQMQWMWNRAYSHCSLLEESEPRPPAEGEWRAALDILDPAATPIMPLDRADVANIGNVPATEKPLPHIAPPKPVAVVEAAPVVRPSAGAAALQQAACLRAHMRTIYAANGHSWRCAR